MSQAKYPPLWNAAGKPVHWESLCDGDLLKVSMDVIDYANTNLFGFFRGVENSGAGPHPEYLILEVPNNIAPNTVPGYCFGRRHSCNLAHVQLVEIVARDDHAARLIFDSIGRLKLEVGYLKDCVASASRALQGHLLNG